MGILNICNLWILLRKIVIYLVIFMDFFAVKVDGSDVIAGISLYENLFTVKVLIMSYLKEHLK